MRVVWTMVAMQMVRDTAKTMAGYHAIYVRVY